ncbi:MAG: GIY-YIG nuclease family protein [Candidatus Spechtbacterales bacterium]
MKFHPAPIFDMFYVYVLQDKEELNIYVGSTNDLRRRFSQHRKKKNNLLKKLKKKK